MNHSSSPVRAFGLRALPLVLAGASLVSCVAPPPGPPPPRVGVAVAAGPVGVAVGPGPLAVLPPGARPGWRRHRRVWLVNGVYYRRGPGGYVVVSP